MSFTVRELPKAKQDKRSIFRWLDERSPTGAAAWLDAYDSLIERLKQDARSFGEAPGIGIVISTSVKVSSRLAAAESIEPCSSLKAKRSTFCGSGVRAKHP